MKAAGVDGDRPFMPVAFTHLSGSREYAALTPAQRLRYNQLCGLMTAEQFVGFERDVIYPAFRRIGREPAIARDQDLSRRLTAMLDDERRHRRMFRDLLARAWPQVYARGGSCFVRLGGLERGACRAPVATRGGALVLIWLALLIEEHSLNVSLAMLGGDSGGLGPPDREFVRIHRLHLRDEARHLPIDLAVLTRCYDRQPDPIRRAQAWLFRRIMRDATTPKRANLLVIDRLIAEFPELEPRRQRLIAVVREESRHQAPDSDVAHPLRHPLNASAWRDRPELSDLAESRSPTAGW